MSKLKVHLLIIDPLNDFMGNDDGTPLVETLVSGRVYTAALPVPGAVSDMQRAARMIDRIGHKVTDIHVTLDSHRRIGIERPGYWVNSKGQHPTPYTIITSQDVKMGIWTPRNPKLRNWAIYYTEQLDAGKKFPLMVWTNHCEIATWGQNVQADLNDALQRWSEVQYASVNYVTKGSNPNTEHYGALMAEVPIPEDPTTLLNTPLLDVVADADIIGALGEASSHCLITTLDQIVQNIGPEHLPKFSLITDCMSPVIAPGVDFPAMTAARLKKMQDLGMKLTTSTDFLA